MRTTHRSAARRRNFAPAVALTILGLGATLPPAALAQGRNDTVALTGQAAPGTGAGTFSFTSAPVLNASGQMAFFSSITGGANSEGIFRSDSGSTLTAIARAGQSAPDTGGGVFGNFTSASVVLNASGQTVFRSSITGGSNIQGIFRSDSGSTLTAIARADQSAPGEGSGTFNSFSGSMELNASGQTAFVSTITGGSNAQGIFRSNSGSTLTAIVRAGQNSPGEGGGTFNSFSTAPVLNASGQTAFFAGIDGGLNNEGIFRSDSGSNLSAIARAGQIAPAAGAGTFGNFSSSSLGLNASGQMVFRSSIAGGSNTQGIFRSDSGSTLTAIALQGQDAPGAGGGTFSDFSVPSLNATGQTAFSAGITGGRAFFAAAAAAAR